MMSKTEKSRNIIMSLENIDAIIKELAQKNYVRKKVRVWVGAGL